jgi:Transcriptional activator TraM
MDQSAIKDAIAEVARRHNLLLDRDDPLLVTLTLNELALNRIIAGQLAAIEAAQDQISAGAAQQIETAREVAGVLITGAARYMAEELRDVIAGHKQALREAVEAEKRQLNAISDGARQAQRSAWHGAIAAIAVSCVLLGVAIGLSVDIGGPAIAPRPAPGSTTARR